MDFHTRSTRGLTRSSTFGMVIISSPVRLPDSSLLKYHVSFKLKATVSSSSWSTILTFSLSSLQQKIHLKYKRKIVSCQMIYEGPSHIQDQCTSTGLFRVHCNCASCYRAHHAWFRVAPPPAISCYFCSLHVKAAKQTWNGQKLFLKQSYKFYWVSHLTVDKD